MANSIGVDYSQGYNIQSLKNGHVDFVCRYIGYTSMSLPQDKIITYSEAYDLLSAGIDIVSLWEWTSDRASMKNTFYNGSPTLAFAGGVADATAAALSHKSIGGPPESPIYFAIDYSTDGTDTVDYFSGVRSVLGMNRVGAYGPPAALMFLIKQGLISYTWAWSPPPQGFTPNIIQVSADVKMGDMTIDIDAALSMDFGQWKASGTLPIPQWFQYPIVVPFGNSSFDVGLGGSHDLDVKPPPNYPVTSIARGDISDISSPTWGRQVGVKLDVPIGGHDYFTHLHLSAVNPTLAVGKHVAYGDLLGWVGGANNIAQYLNTNNPTGHSFVGSSNMSSQIQVGIALHDGPSYGGIGWVNFPPIDNSLDPSIVLETARIGASPLITPTPTPKQNYKRLQFDAVWNSTPLGVKWFGSGLYNARLQSFLANHLGAATPIEDEKISNIGGSLAITDWDGTPIKWQRYDDGSHGEWDASGIGHIYDALGHGA